MKARLRVSVSPSAMLAAAGLLAIVLFYLALLLPGQSFHGGTLTLFTLYFGIVVPPLCFIAGLLTALFRQRDRRARGMLVNAAGLLAYALWVSGGLHKLLGSA